MAVVHKHARQADAALAAQCQELQAQLRVVEERMLPSLWVPGRGSSTCGSRISSRPLPQQRGSSVVSAPQQVATARCLPRQSCKEDGSTWSAAALAATWHQRCSMRSGGPQTFLQYMMLLDKGTAPSQSSKAGLSLYQCRALVLLMSEQSCRAIGLSVSAAGLLWMQSRV